MSDPDSIKTCARTELIRPLNQLAMAMIICAMPTGIDSQQEIPDGYELQPLELGGEILRPVDWKFSSRSQGGTLVYKMWEPLPDGSDQYDTGLTINIVTNVEEAGTTPARYAAQYIRQLAARDVKLVSRSEPTEVNGLIRSGITFDQRMNITDVEKEYRIRYELFADEQLNMLYVLVAGTPVEKWDETQDTFRTMTNQFKLIDTSQGDD